LQTSELTGVVLDYWTARADGLKAKMLRAGERLNGVALDSDICAALTPGFDNWWQPYHVTWFTLGDLIEREGLAIGPRAHPDLIATMTWAAQPYTGKSPQHIGPTPLVAAARAFVASRFGDTVPDEPRAG